MNENGVDCAVTERLGLREGFEREPHMHRNIVTWLNSIYAGCLFDYLSISMNRITLHSMRKLSENTCAWVMLLGNINRAVVCCLMAEQKPILYAQSKHCDKLPGAIWPIIQIVIAKFIVIKRTSTLFVNIWLKRHEKSILLLYNWHNIKRGYYYTKVYLSCRRC